MVAREELLFLKQRILLARRVLNENLEVLGACRQQEGLRQVVHDLIDMLHGDNDPGVLKRLREGIDE